MIYLDYAAHAPADPVVLERFCDMERRFTANPNSVHAAGRAAREQMACAAEQIASLTGAAPSEVIFTSGATEANNLAIKGIAQAARHIGRHIISTPLEHSSVSGSLTALQERGWEIDLLSIGRDGTVDSEEVRELLRSISSCGSNVRFINRLPVSLFHEFVIAFVENGEKGVDLLVGGEVAQADAP